MNPGNPNHARPPRKNNVGSRSPHVHDAIVIGARCAGAATALLLARKGYDVLIVDRDIFPSDVARGHFIHRHGPHRLQRWGLFDRLQATGCPSVSSWTFDQGDFPLVGENLVVDGVPFGIGPRRALLDQVLLDAAIAAGARMRQEFTVDGILRDDGRVLGIRGCTTRGSRETSDFARVTIGADGRTSRLARAVQAETSEAVPTLTCWFFSYWSGVPDRGLEVYVRGRRVIFAFPTNDGLFAIFAAWSSDQTARISADVERHFMAALDRVPDLAERVRGGMREEPFRGAANLPNFLRKPYRSGWALVGDAGCHKDPFMALGVCDAFRDAELLAEALDDGFSGRRSLEAALGDFERQRNDATLHDYHRNLHAARFEPLPAEVRQLRAAVRGEQAATNRFLLGMQGLIPQAEDVPIALPMPRLHDRPEAVPVRG